MNAAQVGRSTASKAFLKAALGSESVLPLQCGWRLANHCPQSLCQATQTPYTLDCLSLSANPGEPLNPYTGHERASSQESRALRSSENWNLLNVHLCETLQAETPSALCVTWQPQAEASLVSDDSRICRYVCVPSLHLILPSI